MDIKKRAEKVKNGNENITQKELLFYIIGRLDDLEEEVQKFDRETTKLKTQIKMFWILIPILLSVAGLVGTLL